MITSPVPTTDVVDIDALRPDPANPRMIEPAELDALERSLRTWGFVQPVVARREDKVVIGGHQRLIAARRLGHRTVPVIWLDLPIEQARLLGIALNKISGSWDDQLLARLILDLTTNPELDMRLSGFATNELGDLLRTLEAREKRDQPETFDLEEALDEAGRSRRAKLGDLWSLGEHRLGCGDATKAEDVDRLLGGAIADMAFCDVPYNVKLGDHGGKQVGAKHRRPIANDALEPAAWAKFVAGWATNVVRVTNGAIYVCMSSKEWPSVSQGLAHAGGHWSDSIIWTKDRFVMGRADYQRTYEPIWYGWREGGSHHWCGDRDQTDVWQIDRPSASPLHPTMKPLALMERAISNSSLPGALILDLFAGSGSTLVAAERTGRRCAALELDPLYVDVILARWERFTGQTAERIDG